MPVDDAPNQVDSATPEIADPPVAGDTSPARPRRGLRKRFKALRGWQKALIIVGVIVVGGVAATGGTALALAHRYESKVQHEDLLGNGDGPPAPQVVQHWKSGPLNLLLLGSDSRLGETGKGHVAGQRSDTIMVVHINAARNSAAVISLPRDSYVNIPAYGSWKGGMNKLNAAFDFGGAPLAAKTITQLTGITFDGAMIASFAGIRTMVDAVGGVNVCVPYDVKSTFSNTTWTKGCHNFTGPTAEEFMRNRKSVPGGDFGRIHDQQLVVQGIINKVSANGLLNNPLTLDKLLVTAAQSLTIDNSINLRQLVLTVKDIKPANIKYGTVPFTNPGLKTSAGSAVELDAKKSASLYAAIRSDTVDQWLLENPTKAPAY